MVGYVLTITLLNLVIGFGIAVFLGWRHRLMMLKPPEPPAPTVLQSLASPTDEPPSVDESDRWRDYGSARDRDHDG